MPFAMTQELPLADDDATAALGRRLAMALRPGDLLLLQGDLGAGKTALARSIIRALLADPEIDVPSPSFALVQPYEGNGRSVLHTDLYRVADPREVDELGLFDRAETIVLCEWPEQADEEFTRRATGEVALSIPPSGVGRLARVTFSDGRGF
jgi:tRNA threonylcarbamoyl adenosine modification protein YjeE